MDNWKPEEPREISEINIVAVGDIRYRFDYSLVNHVEQGKDTYTIYFNDGSLVSYNKRNIICIELNTKNYFKNKETNNVET